MSLQQVNLLTEELIPPKQWLTANQLLVTTGVFALGLMAFSGLDSLNLPKLYDIESQVDQRLRDMTAATPSAPIPDPSPIEIAQKMYIACDGCFSVKRKRTAATMPARLNARAMLFMTIIEMPVTTIGRMMIVCTNDWSTSLERLVMKYAQETGMISTAAPRLAQASLIGP